MTTKLVEAVPALFVTLQVTVVVPIGNWLPELTSVPPPVRQIGVPLVAVTVNVTRAPVGDVAFTVMLPGPTMVGIGAQAGVVIVRVSGSRVPPLGVTVAVLRRLTVVPHGAETFVTWIASGLHPSGQRSPFIAASGAQLGGGVHGEASNAKTRPVQPLVREARPAQD